VCSVGRLQPDAEESQSDTRDHGKPQCHNKIVCPIPAPHTVRSPSSERRSIESQPAGDRQIVSHPAERTEKLRTRRSDTAILNQADRCWFGDHGRRSHIENQARVAVVIASHTKWRPVPRLGRSPWRSLQRSETGPR
jgi:hypothetical protein